MSTETKQKPNPQVEEAIKHMGEHIEMLKTKGIENTSRFRFYNKLLLQEALYDAPETIAAEITHGYVDLPDDSTDEQLEQLAKHAIWLANDLYKALVKNLNYRTNVANEVLKVMMKRK